MEHKYFAFSRCANTPFRKDMTLAIGPRFCVQSLNHENESQSQKRGSTVKMMYFVQVCIFHNFHHFTFPHYNCIYIK